MSGLMSVNEAELANQFPVHYACKVGDVQTVQRLLEFNGNQAAIEDSFLNWTSAHWAAYFGKLDCLKHVISILVNRVDVQTSKSYSTPSHLAAEAGHAHCLLWLLHLGANLNIKDFSGETPLHKCARAGSTECVSLLIAASCDLRITNNAAETSAMLAEHNGHRAIATYIHQAELARELGGNIFERYPLTNGQPCRKRRLDSVAFNNYSKRMRSETPPIMTDSSHMDLPMTDIDTSVLSPTPSLPPITTSVVEHEKLCRMEFGYRDSIFQCMINHFHGF